MALSFDVTLPAEVKPEFPPYCLVSGEENPDSTSTISSHPGNSMRLFFMPFRMLFGRRRVEFPIQRRYKAKFIFERWGRVILFMIPIIGLAFWFMPMLADWPQFARKIAFLAFALAIMSPFFILSVFFPPSFDILAEGDLITYEFKNHDHGLAFYELNKEHVVASDLDDDEDEEE